MINEFLLTKKPVTQESTKKHFMKLNRYKHIALKTNDEEMDKLQKEIMRQYNKVNKVYSPDIVKQQEGEELRQKTAGHTSRPHVGYNRVVSPRKNKNLLRNLFFMEKFHYYSSGLYPGTKSLYCLSKLGKYFDVTRIAEVHNINVVIPPSLIIGFDDNRLVYTSRANRAMKVKFTKPDYESKYYQNSFKIILIKISIAHFLNTNIGDDQTDKEKYQDIHPKLVLK